MFSIIKPGMRMADVDATARRYNAERLVEAGVMKSVDEIGTYMWHAGAHHIGYDVHDVVEMPEFVAPGMMFCVDIGIYHEEVGHRLPSGGQLSRYRERLARTCPVRFRAPSPISRRKCSTKHNVTFIMREVASERRRLPACMRIGESRTHESDHYVYYGRRSSAGRSGLHFRKPSGSWQAL